MKAVVCLHICKHYTAGAEEAILYINKIVFMLVVQRAAMHCVQAKLPTILTDISLKYAKLSRFLRKTQWMDVTKRVKDKRELHHVTNRKC